MKLTLVCVGILSVILQSVDGKLFPKLHSVEPTYVYVTNFTSGNGTKADIQKEIYYAKVIQCNKLSYCKNPWVCCYEGYFCCQPDGEGGVVKRKGIRNVSWRNHHEIYSISNYNHI